MTRAAYLAAEGFESVLTEELARRGVAVSTRRARLALSPDAPVPAAWALDAWTDPREIAVP
jgi:23S rRNA (cytidine2498-2'-O)-methyltransferase